MSKQLQLYIHIPFCIKKCPYCTACVLEGNSSAKLEYLAALEREFDAALPDLAEYEIASLYVGGGSPSCMNADALTKTVTHITRKLSLPRGTEKTIELMPQTIGTPSLSGMHPSGYTRFSLSMQSGSDEELATLGCGFTVQDVQNAVLFLDKFRMNNVNLDLMLGIPGQTLKSWERTLKIAQSFAPVHLSLYEFTADEAYHSQAKHSPVDSDTKQQMHAFAAEYLESIGFKQYTKFHFALPGRESRWHKQRYEGMDYWGLGLGARSLVEGLSWSNTTDWETYRDHSDEFESITSRVVELSECDRKEYLTASKALLV